VIQRAITPDYFTVMRIPMLRGRPFNPADGAGVERVAILSDAAERAYFPGEDAIGQVVRIDKVDRRIVGVVRGSRTNGPESPVWPEIYMPVAQEEISGADFVLRTTADPWTVRAAVADAVHAVRPDQVIREMQTLEGYFGVYAARPKFTMQLLALFAILGVVITAVGIYGVMSFLVAQRTREIGVRMALGARPSQVLTRVIGRAAAYVAMGLVLGLAAAWVLSQFVSVFLFQIDGRAPAIYITAAVVTMVAGVAAAAAPARRAARVDPLDALRAG